MVAQRNIAASLSRSHTLAAAEAAPHDAAGQPYGVKWLTCAGLLLSGAHAASNPTPQSAPAPRYRVGAGQLPAHLGPGQATLAHVRPRSNAARPMAPSPPARRLLQSQAQQATSTPLIGCPSSGFSTQVTVGGQALMADADTGSWAFAVVSNGCTECGIAPAYVPSDASFNWSQPVSTTYVQGNWSGNLLSDQVAFAGGPSLPIKFGAITATSGFFEPYVCNRTQGAPAPQVRNQGVMGLAPNPTAPPSGFGSYISRAFDAMGNVRLQHRALSVWWHVLLGRLCGEPQRRRALFYTHGHGQRIKLRCGAIGRSRPWRPRAGLHAGQFRIQLGGHRHHPLEPAAYPLREFGQRGIHGHGWALRANVLRRRRLQDPVQPIDCGCRYDSAQARAIFRDPGRAAGRHARYLHAGHDQLPRRASRWSRQHHRLQHGQQKCRSDHFRGRHDAQPALDLRLPPQPSGYQPQPRRVATRLEKRDRLHAATTPKSRGDCSTRPERFLRSRRELFRTPP